MTEATPRKICTAVAALVLASVAFGTAAAETSHGTHQHGAAEVDLALERSDVLVNFASPLYNLVGFEHAPRDAADREAVAAARVLLDDPGNLVVLQPDAGCAVVELDIHWEMASAESAEDQEHDHDAAHEHDSEHADEHDSHDADDHDAHDADEAHHHDDDDHDGDEQHADITVAIRYTCDRPDQLNSMDVTAFSSFERLSEVELRAVGPGGAVAESLERGAPQVDLRGLFGR